MKHYAAHQVRCSLNEPTRKLWVVSMEGQRVVRLHPFTEEQPFTEWIGGLILVTSKSSCTLTFPLSLQKFIQEMLSGEEDGAWNEEGESLSETPHYAWYITPDEVAKSIVVRPRILPCII